MSRRRHTKQFGPKERIAAFAAATEAYAETLKDPCLANVYRGKSLGLRQAVEILAAEDRMARPRRRRAPAAECYARRTSAGTTS